MLKVPTGAETAFRLVYAARSFGTWTFHVYGARRRGWFVASQRHPRVNRDVGPTSLHKGEWRTLLNFVQQAGFWELPAILPDPPGWEYLDGDAIELAGRSGERFHRVQRGVWREPGLDRILQHCLRICRMEEPRGDRGDVAPCSRRDENGSASDPEATGV